MNDLKQLDARRQLMIATKQPSNSELQSACLIAAFLNDITDFSRIFAKRTTWLGKDDLDLMFKLQKFERNFDKSYGFFDCSHELRGNNG